jgi:hypothetical protein
MPFDYDRLADEVVKCTQMLVEKAIAPLRAENAALVARIVELEARAPVPGPAGPQGEKGDAGERGADGLPGERGADGMLPLLRAWEDRVYRAGECAVIAGATWQASKDTGKAPPHDDWTCIAAKGVDGRGLLARGTYDPEDVYKSHEIVALNGGSFVALTDDPGECPGPGWQLLTAPGKRGQRGEDGQRGPEGAEGPQGKDGASPVALTVTDDGVLTLTLETGDELVADFYPILRGIK